MDQDRPDRPDRPDHGIPTHGPANKEKAEGSRETVGATEDAGGITNRPLEREEKEQNDVPPRGQRRDETRSDEDDGTLKTKI
jgi:hypothetical protein